MSLPPSHKKRKLTSLTRPVSPPPNQQSSKLTSRNDAPITPLPPQSQPDDLGPEVDTSRTVENILNIISWNINGTQHLLPSSESANKKITSFFSSRTNAKHHSSSTISASDSDTEKPRTVPPLREFLRRHKYPGILCLQEVKISPSDTKTQNTLRRAANATDRDDIERNVTYDVTFSLPRDKYNARGLGGKGKVHGVATLVRKDLILEHSVLTKDVKWDLEGRVLCTEITHKPHRDTDDSKTSAGSWSLVLINGYWPNGTTIPYRSPETGEVVGTRHDFKRLFHSRMLATIKTYSGTGWHVVLIGDMNIAPASIDGFPGIRLAEEHVRNRADFNWKFLSQNNADGMGGVDAWREVHGERRAYTYHGESAKEWGRSCDRVDLAVVGRSLVGMGVLTAASIWESVEERGGSDHVPIGVAIDVGRLGGVEDRSDT